MVEVVAFASAEAVMVAYLRAELGARGETATVATRVPATRPAELVRVMRVGGTRDDIITDGAMLTFDCWAPNEIAAEALAAMVRALVGAMPDRSDTCRRVTEVGGPVNQPDPDTNSPRYVFTALAYLRGHTI